MYTMDDLFDVRNVVGRKLEQLITKRGITKRSACEGAGISRPTLDKILAGELTNKANFEKHVTKILAFLALTPNELMGQIENPYNEVSQLRKALRRRVEEVSAACNISVEEIQNIEAGEEVPLAVLRDIACYLGTSVRGLRGENYFQTTLSSMGDFIDNDPTSVTSPGAFWGHLGILLKGQTRYQWYPITAYTRQIIYHDIENPYMVVPCMDNSLLLINTENIGEATLLDEACDAPVELDWDRTVSEGEIPPVIYEAFDDYIEYAVQKENPEEFDLSARLAATMDKYVEKQKIDPEEFSLKLQEATLYFKNGTEKVHLIDWGRADGLVNTVKYINEMGELIDGSMVTFEGLGGEEFFLNLKNIAMVKLPLAKVEDAIALGMEEL